MDKIKIANFKAFDNEIFIDLNRKNLLLYGENGAGKSSLYEAIKVIFFQDRIAANLHAITPEDLLQLTNELWDSYNNKIINSDFVIEINGVNYNSFISEEYQVFMISIAELSFDNGLNLRTILEKAFFSFLNINEICESFYDIVEDEVNKNLIKFIENVSISIEKEDDYNILISDVNKNIDSKFEIRKYFNEAKLNLIVLLVLLTVADISKNEDKRIILVLDDFITSLDSSNRTFIIKYIFDNFQNSQLLIFTHNISFYNLIMYMINENNGLSDNWLFSNLFEINNIHKLSIKSELEKVEEIKADFIGLTDASSHTLIESIGNRIRKKFEVLLYEYSKIMMIGTVEDSKKIFARIANGKAAYYSNNKTASDLIDLLQNILLHHDGHNLKSRLQSAIDTYKNNDFNNFKKILRELKLYQKVTMHPMSHGVLGMSTFTIKEISKSIDLLEKMEKSLKDLIGQDVSTV